MPRTAAEKAKGKTGTNGIGVEHPCKCPFKIYTAKTMNRAAEQAIISVKIEKVLWSSKNPKKLQVNAKIL